MDDIIFTKLIILDYVIVIRIILITNVIILDDYSYFKSGDKNNRSNYPTIMISLLLAKLYGIIWIVKLNRYNRFLGQVKLVWIKIKGWSRRN